MRGNTQWQHPDPALVPLSLPAFPFNIDLRPRIQFWIVDNAKFVSYNVTHVPAYHCSRYRNGLWAGRRRFELR
jgi:hypothetical protein